MPAQWQHTDGGPGRAVLIEGKEYLYFSGTSYLGLNQHETFKALVQEGIDRYGVNFGGSRRSNLRFDLFSKAEDLFCTWTGAPASLLFSSGTLAGQILHRIMSKLGQVLYAPGTHPALWGVTGLPSVDYEAWTLQLQTQLQQRQEICVIFANSIDPLRSRAYDFDWVAEIPAGPPVYIVIDDSHGFGVTGPEGIGVYKSLKTPAWVKRVVLASLGKAFSLPAGIILGEKEIIDQCWDSPFFGGASPLPPAYLYALLAAPSLWRKQLEVLRTRIDDFDQSISAFPYLQHLEGYPVYFCLKNELAAQLWEKGIMISSFPYPGPNDPLVTRIVINALHQQMDVDRLVKAMQG